MRRLLIRPGALGDFLVSLPALEALRGDYTEVWTATPHLPLIRFADRVRGLSTTGLDLLELGLSPPSLLEQLRGFDSIVSWYGTARAQFRESVQGLPFHFFPALPGDAGVHATGFYASQAESLGITVRNRTPRLAVPRIGSMPYAVIHPFSGSRNKNWPFDRFESLAARLDLPVAFTAGPEEALPPGLPSRRFDNLWDLAQWLGNAAYYIGNDSGPSHLAAAVGTPTLAIFGPSDERIWAPCGASVVRSAGAAPWPGVEEVLAALVELRRCTEENLSSGHSAGG